MRLPFFTIAAWSFATANLHAAEKSALRPSSLSWVRRAGAESCPGPLAMAQAVEKRLQRAVFVPTSQTDLAIEAYVEPASPSGWHVVIHTSGPDGSLLGQRELSSKEVACAAVTEPAALAIALMIDPDATLAPPPPVPQPPARESTMPQPAETPAARWQGIVALFGGLYAGLLPKLAPGFVVRGLVIPPPRFVGLEVSGAYFAPQAEEVSDGFGSDFSLFLAGVAICTAPAFGRLRFAASLCGGAQTGAIAQNSYGFLRQENHVTPIFNLEAHGQLSLEVHPHLLILAGAGAVVPLRRDTFEVRNAGETPQRLFQMAALGGGFEIGAAYSF